MTTKTGFQLWQEGRVHSLDGQSCFDYVGAIFHRRDFLSENEARFQRKLDEVIEWQERFARYDAERNAKGETGPYTNGAALNFTPFVSLPPSVRTDRRNALREEIREKLALDTQAIPHQPSEHEAAYIARLDGLPEPVRRMAELQNLSYAHNPFGGRDANEKPLHFADELFPKHPSFSYLKESGGSLIPSNPFDADSPRTVYTCAASETPRANGTIGKTLEELIVHEGFGHPLFNAMKSRQGPEGKEHAKRAAEVDIGPLFKPRSWQAMPEDLKAYWQSLPPNPAIDAAIAQMKETKSGRYEMGRLGMLDALFHDPKSAALSSSEFYGALKAFDAERTPVLSSVEEQQAWVSGVRAVVNSAMHRMGPNGDMHAGPLYASHDGYIDEHFVNLSEMLYAEKLDPAMLEIVLPNMIDFWKREVIPNLDLPQIPEPLPAQKVRLLHATPNLPPDATTLETRPAWTDGGAKAGNFIFAAPAPVASSGTRIGALSDLYAFKLADKGQIVTENGLQREAGHFTNLGFMGQAYPVAYAIGVHRNQYLKALAASTPQVLEVPADRFEAVRHPRSGKIVEYISRAPIPLSECKVVKRFSGIEELLETGAQLFFVRDGAEKQFFAAQRELGERMSRVDAKRGSAMHDAFLKEMCAQGMLVHENAERGIRPIHFDDGRVPEAPSTLAPIQRPSFVESIRKRESVTLSHPQRPELGRFTAMVKSAVSETIQQR